MKTYVFTREASPRYWKQLPQEFVIGDQVQEFNDPTYNYMVVRDLDFGPVRTIGVMTPGAAPFRVPASWLQEIEIEPVKTFRDDLKDLLRLVGIK